MRKEQTAREAAYLALSRTRTRSGYADRVLADVLNGAGLSPRDAALATEITYGVLQNRLFCDNIIGKFSKVPVRKMENAVLELLRIALYQLYFLDKVPHSAAVNETVKLARKLTNPRAAGFINAVLRAVTSDGLPLFEAAGDTRDKLSLRYSLPRPMIDDLLSSLPEDEWEEFCKSCNAPPPVTIQVNTLQVSEEKLARLLCEAGVECERHPFLKDSLNLRHTGDIKKLDEFVRGYFWVADASGVLAVLSAKPQPGEQALDVCAAPGGKTFALAREMKDKGSIIACDIHPHKIDVLSEGAARLGFQDIVTAAFADAVLFHATFENRFDIVFCDVPCSGLGVLRKKPDIRYKEPESFDELCGIQLSILSNSSRYVKKGGRLLYATCTLRRQENGDIVQKFLEENPGFIKIEEKNFYPHRDGTDGFYYCLLRKNDD